MSSSILLGAISSDHNSNVTGCNYDQRRREDSAQFDVGHPAENEGLIPS